MSLGIKLHHCEIVITTCQAHLVWESTEHLCLNIISELVEGEGRGPLEVSQPLLCALNVENVTEVGGENLKQ